MIFGKFEETSGKGSLIFSFKNNELTIVSETSTQKIVRICLVPLITSITG